MNIEVLGGLAGFFTTISFLPQVIRVLRTRETSGISLVMYFAFVVGVALWVCYGVALHRESIIVANVVTLVLAGWVLVLKCGACLRGEAW